jgi:putative transposase
MLDGIVKYHVVFIPKKRQELVYGAIRKHLGATFHELAKRKGVTIEEGHLIKDHVHMCISVPPKYSISNVVGYLKGKSAISIATKLALRRFVWIWVKISTS